MAVAWQKKISRVRVLIRAACRELFVSLSPTIGALAAENSKKLP
jgi:hypothetical protein